MTRSRPLSVLITGAAGALGGAIASRLIDDGGAVVGLDLSPISDGRYRGLTVDVTSEDSVAEAALALERDGQLFDGLVCAAGIEGISANIEDLSSTDFDRVQQVNVTGLFRSLKHFGGLLRDGASIVTVASTSGLMGNPGVSAYVASKHAVIGLTRSAAIEFAQRSIRVNCVAPGPYESVMMEAFEANAPDRTLRSWYEENTPLGRFGRVDEVAALTCFLLSADASFLTGGVHVCDGGLSSSGRPFRRMD